MKAPRPLTTLLRPLVLLTASSLAPMLSASPALGPSAPGDTGVIAMPSARVEEDGTLRIGLTYSDPYPAMFASMTVFPGLEGAFLYTGVNGVEENPAYGAYKDKQFHLKWRMLEESGWRPALAIGVRDAFGTRVFPAQYLVASKSVGEFDLTLGYGAERMDGTFGSIAYTPRWAERFSALAEYDANDYASDFRSDESGAALRDGRFNFGVQFRGGDWGVALTSESGELGGKLWLAFAFGKPDLVPKTKEPPPLTKADRAPTPAADWRPAPEPSAVLAQQLYAQGFARVDVALKERALDLRLTHNRITLIGRTVGRAARTALLFGPADMDRLRITYTQVDLPIATYEFRDIAVLKEYFAGRVGPDRLGPTLTVRYADPVAQAAFGPGDVVYSRDLLDEPVAETNTDDAFKRSPNRDLFYFQREAGGDSSIGFKPLVVKGFFNDLGGAFRYDIFAAGYYSQRFAPGLYGTGTVRLTLLENVSEVDTPSNSTLPHVRSDVALYKEHGPFKMENLYLAKFAQLDERLYLRASTGYYEEMFFGTGGQLLYLPAKGNWAFDLSLEYAKQRDYDGGFELLGYETVTAIGAIHYRFPAQGVTATVRGGVFLAGDEGYRFELQRRLRSGVTFGAWYTITNGNDITSPGAPGDPYYDKGVYISIPLRITLPYDTKASGAFALSPWTRDVGQMIFFPGDLYTMFEQALLLNTTDYNPLSQFGR
jgi:hypothetical protein